jgi:ABC-type uncharacterized transport system permease subunit
MTVSSLQGVTHACFGLSYLIALVLELARLVWPRAGVGWRIAALIFGVVGLLTHTYYILAHQPTPAIPSGSLLLLGWILALFCFYGAVHHSRQAWAVFVLPVVIGLVGLSYVLSRGGDVGSPVDVLVWLSGDRFWGAVHGSLILLAAVGVSVGFLASLMYLVQARRIRNKINPGRVTPLFSLERLEMMNRRALNLAFPLLTAGLLVGLLIVRHGMGENWLSLKVFSTAGLWLVFLVLLYLRYGAHVPSRRLAMLSIAAFGLLLVALATAHPFALRSTP